jgi:hypothetical protein
MTFMRDPNNGPTGNIWEDHDGGIIMGDSGETLLFFT